MARTVGWRKIARAIVGAGMVVGCGGETSGPSAGSGGGTSTPTCGTIRAADYDQTCTMDSDCVGVFEGNLCAQLCNCTNAAVSGKAQAQYEADFSSKVRINVNCPCPSGPAIVCNGGVCAPGSSM